FLPKSLLANDFNKDRHLDIAVLDAFGKVGRLTGDGTGFFALTGTFDAGDSPSSFAAGDVNNDGFLDLVIANNKTATNTGQISVLLNASGNGFSDAPISINSSAFNNVNLRSVVVTHVDQ